MATPAYSIIRTKSQYRKYCKTLEQLVDGGVSGHSGANEVDLLTRLIENWDGEHNSFEEVDPIRLLHSFMEDHGMTRKDLVKLLKMSKGYTSDILNYKKGLPKEVIRDLSAYFKVSHEAFSRPYNLKS